MFPLQLLSVLDNGNLQTYCTCCYCTCCMRSYSSFCGVTKRKLFLHFIFSKLSEITMLLVILFKQRRFFIESVKLVDAKWCYTFQYFQVLRLFNKFILLEKCHGQVIFKAEISWQKRVASLLLRVPKNLAKRKGLGSNNNERYDI